MERSYARKRRNWRPLAKDDPISVDIEKRLHTASDIDTQPADIETLQDYDQKINDYKAREFTYIPLPGDGKYCNTEEGWTKGLGPGQFVDEDTHLMEVLRLLQEEPFLLGDYKSNSLILIYEGNDEAILLHSKEHSDKSYASNDKTREVNSIEEDETENIEFYTIGAARQEFPHLKQLINDSAMVDIEYDEERYGIITLADVNRRGVKIMIYVVISGLVSQLFHKIEAEYPDSKSLFKYISPNPIGRWHKDRVEGLEIHILEHLNLIDIMNVVQASSKSFVEECGFELKSAVEDLSSINDTRKRVMHANRSLIHDRRDIQDMLSRINRAQEIVSAMD